MAAGTTVNRRDFFKASATGGAALLIGFYLPFRAFADEAQQQEKKPPNPFNAWVRIGQDDRVMLILAKSEMGQGVMTALPMILAEELSVDWKKVQIEQAPTDPSVYDHGTGGSSSVPESWLPLRRAGAAAREMLVTAAAQRWSVNRDTCKAENGAVIHGARKKIFTYGELAGDAAKLPIPDFNTVPLKNSDDFTIVGRDTPRVEARAKTDGTAKFGLDTRAPGMVYAAIARCPVFGGKAAKFDATKAKAVPGVRDVVAIDAIGTGAFTAGGVAVAADSTWAALQGRKALDITWDEGPAAAESSESLRQQFAENAAKPGKVYRNEGDAEATFVSAEYRTIKADYELPFAAHVCMEPMNCTVHVRADGAEAWVPSQGPQWARDIIGKIAGVPPESVIVHTTLMGGGFGRRYQADFVAEAAQVSKAVGKPVMVVWTREDDMQHDFYRPASFHRMTAALDGKGDLAAWKHFQTSTSIAAMWEANGAEKPEQSEFGTAAFIPYRASSYRVEYALAKSSVPRAWWRSVEHSSSGFVVESFVDELAAAAKEDPLQFRLRLIGETRKVPDFTSPTGDPLDTARLKGVLQLAAEKADWGQPLPKGPGKMGRGIAGYFSFNSYAAIVIEVGVRNGEVRVARAVATVDVGRAVNPQGVRAQVESAVTYALTAALKDAITIQRGRIAQSNFHNYEMLRMREAPRVEVHIIPSSEKPTGIGEPCVPVVAPALCNALYAATGKRLRRLPIRPQDLA